MKAQEQNLPRGLFSNISQISLASRGSERVNTMVRAETFVNPRQCIQTVLAAQARLLPLQRQCP